MAGILARDPLRGLLYVEPEPAPQGILGAVTANPLMARQFAAQRQVPKAQPLLPNALTSWSQFGPALEAYARQNFPIDSPQAVEQAAFSAAMGVGPLATVFHGSPHRFDKFDMSKVGTGEGAQAYGHGLYFAENPAVAKGYADNVLDMAKIDSANKRMSELARIMDQEAIPGQYRKFRSDVGRQAADEYDALMAKKMEPGNLYKVDLPDEAIGKMLDWDKPLSQQPESIRDAIQASKYAGYFEGRTVAQAYNAITKDHGGDQLMASSILSDLGVTGIKYLDQGSRSSGRGTHNFVVFDDKIPRIVGRE